jgi:hypothetical protein
MHEQRDGWTEVLRHHDVAEGRARARWLGGGAWVCGFMGKCERAGRADGRGHAMRGRGGKVRVGRAHFVRARRDMEVGVRGGEGRGGEGVACPVPEWGW